MDKILHDPKDPKLWELCYIPYSGSCRILSINSSMELDPKIHNGDGFLGPDSIIIVVYMDPLGPTW